MQQPPSSSSARVIRLYICISEFPSPLLQDGAEYPLTQPGPYGRWFHTEFCDFVSVLVAQIQHSSIIFDGYLMNTVVALLTELSDSCVRAFRHTCTLAGGGAAAKNLRVPAYRQTSDDCIFFDLHFHSGQAGHCSGGRGPESDRQR